MEPLKIATVQFETRDNDKVYNLSIIREMCRKASVEGADVVAFHECSVCGYTFAKDLSRKELLAIAEPIPTGESTQALIAIAKEFGVTLLAGFFERDGDRIYKAQVCVDGNGLKAKYRKLHPFINPNILPGDQYVVFEIKGWKCGILICYDNNIIENVRATALLGADIIFMPHVTMCTPSPRPGAGLINPMLWENRANDPTSLRQEFDGLKGVINDGGDILAALKTAKEDAAASSCAWKALVFHQPVYGTIMRYMWYSPIRSGVIIMRSRTVAR